MNQLTGMTYLVKLACRPGAIRWTAPEILPGEESASAATTRSDMYSMPPVSTGVVPWRHLTNDTAILLKVIDGKIHPRPNVTDQHWDFMVSCWSMIPIDRPAVEFVAREISLLQLNDGLVTDITSPNSHCLSLCSSRPSSSSSSYSHACAEHFPGAPP